MVLRRLVFLAKTINFLLLWNLLISQAIEEDKFDDKIDGVADPCTDASLFWGDQALTADDVRRIFGREPHEVLGDLGQAAAHKRARNETAGKAELMKEIERRDRRKKRAVTSLPERKWPHAVIPYEISSNFTSKQRSIFYQAMRHWELHTCVTFIEHTGRPENPHIIFTQRPCGCCSFVGRRGLGAQAISIGKNCDKFGIVVHELGHVVGFWHEHTRPDRDDYIKVVYENIQENQDYNFQKMPPNEIDSLQEPYDFDSIMHYSRNTFAKGAFMDTLRPILQPGISIKPSIGQRIKLSPGDKIQARKLYRCPSCGQTLQTPTGNFSSPGYPAVVKYDKQLHCEWRISTTPGETLEVNISDLGFASDANCHYDFLEIYDGPTMSDRMIGKYCRDNMPKRNSFTTTTHRMFVKYRKVSRQSDSVGFRMEYKAICGGTITLEDGSSHEIVSPNNPDKYPPNSNCAWEVHAPPGYKIGLELNEFEVEHHESCTYDYLEVRDGATKSSPLIKKWCGFKAPDPIKSTGEKLFIEFKSDNNVNKGGFIANLIPEKDECLLNNGGCQQLCHNRIGGFECQCQPGYHLKDDGVSCDPSCGGILQSPTGEITSPGYPKEYPPDKECLWMIVAPPDYKIILTFNHLDIEDPSGTEEGCEYDYLELRSGLLATSPLLGGKICSVRTDMPSVTSTRNHMRVFFRSDASVGKAGFNVTYQRDIDECQKNNGGCSHLCVNEPGSFHCACRAGYTLYTDKRNCKEEPQCESTFDVTESQDKFYSPGYSSGRYPEKANCKWKLRTKDGHRIRIKWEEFDVEPQEDCGYDRVELSEQKRLVQKICRPSPHDYISRSNDVDVHFFSDNSIQKKGFKAVYSSECGGNFTVTDSERTIYSHASIGEKDYPTDADCTWTLKAPRRQDLPGIPTKVRLTYQMFEIEKEPTCKYDYLEVNSVSLVEKRCDEGKPSTWPSSKPYTEILTLPVTLRFQSDGTITKKGFQIKYSLLQRRRNTMRHPNAQN